MKINYLIPSLLFLFLVTGLMAQVTETRTFSPFTALKVAGDFDITIVPGTEEKVEWQITGAESAKVISEVKEGVLTLRLKGLLTGATVKGTLYYKTLASIDTRTSAVVRSKDTLTFEKLAFIAGPDGLSDLRIKCGDLSVTGMAGADLYFYGKVTNLAVTANAGATIRMEGMEAENAAVESLFGSAVYVWVKGKLTAKAYGGATIYYAEKPSELITETGTGGEVKER